MSPGDLLASPLGSQLCWAPILGELSFASLWALLTSINGRSASWASLAGNAQLRQKKLTSTMGGQLAGLPSTGSLSFCWRGCPPVWRVSHLGSHLWGGLSCASFVGDAHMAWSPVASPVLLPRVVVTLGLGVTLLTILRSCTGAPPRTVWPSRIKER